MCDRKRILVASHWLDRIHRHDMLAKADYFVVFEIGNQILGWFLNFDEFVEKLCASELHLTSIFGFNRRLNL